MKKKDTWKEWVLATILMIGNRLPDTYKFMGYSITKVEEIWNEENKNG